MIIPEYNWKTAAHAIAEDLKFSCECGEQIERKKLWVGDEVECECGIRYELDTTAFMKKIEEAS